MFCAVYYAVLIAVWLLSFASSNGGKGMPEAAASLQDVGVRWESRWPAFTPGLSFSNDRGIFKVHSIDLFSRISLFRLEKMNRSHVGFQESRQIVDPFNSQQVPNHRRLPPNTFPVRHSKSHRITPSNVCLRNEPPPSSLGVSLHMVLHLAKLLPSPLRWFLTPKQSSIPWFFPRWAKSKQECKLAPDVGL